MPPATKSRHAFLLLIYGVYLLAPPVDGLIHALEAAGKPGPAQDRQAARLGVGCGGDCDNPTHHHGRLNHAGHCVICALHAKNLHDRLQTCPGKVLFLDHGIIEPDRIGLFVSSHSSADAIRAPPADLSQSNV